MARSTDPLLFTEPIVDAEGKPTPYFMRQWGGQREINTSVNDIDLIAGTGLEGGGDLSGPDRTFDLADTTVISNTYGDATHVPRVTVDQQGRLTFVEDVLLGDGSKVAVFNWPSVPTNVFSSSAFATKGSVETFFKDITISNISVHINATTGHTYKAGIYSIDGAGVIQTVEATSLAFVATTTGSQVINFSIVASLIAGVRYFFAVSRTDGGDTFVLPAAVTGSATDVLAYKSLPTVPYAETTLSTFGRIAKATPIVGDTVNTGTQAFVVGLTAIADAAEANKASAFNAAVLDLAGQTEIISIPITKNSNSSDLILKLNFEAINEAIEWSNAGIEFSNAGIEFSDGSFPEVTDLITKVDGVAEGITSLIETSFNYSTKFAEIVIKDILTGSRTVSVDLDPTGVVKVRNRQATVLEI